jgi:hypothetical protein
VLLELLAVELLSAGAAGVTPADWAAPDCAVLLCWAAFDVVALASEPFACVLAAPAAAGAAAAADWSVPVVVLLVWLLTGGVVCAAAAEVLSAGFAEAVSVVVGAALADWSVEVAAPEVPPVVLAIPGFALPLLLSQVGATSLTSETLMLFCIEDWEEVLPEAVLVALELAVAESCVPVTETLCPTRLASWLSLPESL